jgi:hypothetical protein
MRDARAVVLFGGLGAGGTALSLVVKRACDGVYKDKKVSAPLIRFLVVIVCVELVAVNSIKSSSPFA